MTPGRPAPMDLLPVSVDAIPGPMPQHEALSARPLTPSTIRLHRPDAHRLAQRDGWFAPASEILDFLRSRRATTTMPRSERQRLELRWMAERLAWRFKRAVRKRR